MKFKFPQNVSQQNVYAQKNVLYTCSLTVLFFGEWLSFKPFTHLCHNWVDSFGKLQNKCGEIHNLFQNEAQKLSFSRTNT